MEAQEYKNIYKNEGKHFFYRANHDLFLTYISRLRTEHKRPLKILDAGCGTGLLAKKLKKFGEVIGVDVSSRAVYFSRKRGINVKRASINKLPFRSGAFDIVVSMDVLYHKKVNDRKALSEIYRVLRKGGRFLIRVPANPALFSSHDRFVHTRERYTKEKLAKKLKNAGFELEKISYVNTVLFLPALLKVAFEKIIKQKSTSSSVKQIHWLLNQAALALLLFENLILNYSFLPAGIGLFAVAKKQKNT